MSPNLPRCSECDQRIRFAGSPFTGKPRAFEVREVDGRTYPGVAYPSMGARAWRFTELVDEVQQLRQCSRADAEDEVYDMPWLVLHDCRQAPTNNTPEGT